MDLDMVSQERMSLWVPKIVWYIPTACDVVGAPDFSKKNGALEVRSSPGLFVYT